MSTKNGNEWPLVVLILGIMAIGAALVISGHKEGIWLIILPVIGVFFL